MKRGSAFIANKTQAARLPKSAPLPEGVAAVDIVRLGGSWVITSAGDSWTTWFGREAASRDFMGDREQPAEQERASP
jgi:antitoxin VapB